MNNKHSNLQLASKYFPLLNNLVICESIGEMYFAFSKLIFKVMDADFAYTGANLGVGSEKMTSKIDFFHPVLV